MNVGLGVGGVLVGSGLVLMLLLWTGDGRKSQQGTGLEIPRATIALALGLGSLLALAAIIASGDPNASLAAAPDAHAVMVVAMVAGAVWWLAEWLSQRRSPGPEPAWKVWPLRGPGSQEGHQSPEHWNGNEARIDEVRQRVAHYRLRLNSRHVMFAGVVFIVVGVLLAVMPIALRSYDCGSVLMYLRGDRTGGMCLNALVGRAWMSLPTIALGVIALAGALLLPLGGSEDGAPAA